MLMEVYFCFASNLHLSLIYEIFYAILTEYASKIFRITITLNSNHLYHFL